MALKQNPLTSICFLFTLLILMSSCAPQSNTTTTPIQKVADNIGCDNVESKIFDALYEYVNEKDSLPDMNLLSEELVGIVENHLVNVQNISDRETIDHFTSIFLDFFNSLVGMTMQKQKVSKEEILQALIEFELQDQSSEEQHALSQQLQDKIQTLKAQAQNMKLDCKTPDPIDQNDVPVPPPTPADPTIQQKLANGVSNVFATAYQSCRALEIPPMDANSADVEGIKVLAEPNPENGGKQRVITSVAKVKDTHPWVRVSSPGSNTCYNVRGNPLIYDFGGKPKWSSNTIDFFTNSGSGTTVLGVDCSGFVGTVLSATGARYAPGVDNKPVYINQKSDKFINAKSSGFKCFDNISVKPTETIKPGDIAAIKGHVIMIDAISADPFGLKKITSQSKCHQVTASNFDFIVAQSSPSNNGVGINKYKAKDYLNDNDEMRELFIEMAKASCQALFTKKTVTPNFSDYGIIRHKGTKECLAPKATLAKQACVNACIK